MFIAPLWEQFAQTLYKNTNTNNTNIFILMCHMWQSYLWAQKQGTTNNMIVCINVSLMESESLEWISRPNIVWQRVPCFGCSVAESSGTSDQHSFWLSKHALTTCRWPQGPRWNSILDMFRQVGCILCLADLEDNHSDLEWFMSPNRQSNRQCSLARTGVI